MPQGSIFTPTGMMMLFIAGIFDAAGWLSAVLIAVFGIGVLMGQIVNVLGFAIIGAWVFSRSGTMPTKKPKAGKGEGMAQGLIKKFLKKQWKKLIIEACPILGDIYPGFVAMVYSELKGGD